MKNNKEETTSQEPNHTFSIEKIVHFQCGKCQKWWSIADAPLKTKEDWTCPWCSYKSSCIDKTTKNINDS